MNKFVEVAKQTTEHTLTTNGAISWDTTSDGLVDLFGCIGAMRENGSEDIRLKFIDAFSEDALLATKMLFYARNVRGGLGERRTFRVILNFLAMNYPEIVTKNIAHIATFGRYDDYYTLINTPCETVMWSYLQVQFNEDIANMQAGKPISLLAKWLKSEKTSSPHSRKLARLTIEAFGITNKEYRQALVSLRAYLKVVETHMSAQNWGAINYAAVPSRAMNLYRNAFVNRDQERFEEYISSLIKGETKINASTLYPYDIVEKVLYNYEKNPVLEEQWKALPNYVEGTDNVLTVVDTSGSMYGRPLAAALGLGLYFAERNHSDFKDLFITFSEKPEFVKVKGKTLYDKINNMSHANWDMNTNFRRVFSMILDLAKAHKIPAEDMPKSLVVISDMQFDCASCDDYKWDFYTGIREEYRNAGYAAPNIVFWNATDYCHDTYHARSNYAGVQMVSGYSASSFKTVLANIGRTPYEAMINTLNDPLYDCIRV